MNISKTLYAKNRKEWRSWLSRNHRTAPEVWLVSYKKHTGETGIDYNAAVEEALCYGWIDSIVKRLDEDRTAQRFSPRRKNSQLSETNKERIRRLIKAKKMTRFGLSSIENHIDKAASSSRSQKLIQFKFPADILRQIKSDPDAWRSFTKFPAAYKRMRIGWINGARKRPDEFKKRLRYFVKMTAQNKKFGKVQ